MEYPVLYRKRYEPEELVCLKDDRFLCCKEDFIVTSWETLKPRKDIARGISAYYLPDGFKVGKIYNHQNQLVYWYCDIIDTEYHPRENTYIFHDMLLDVVMYPNGDIRILDLDELADCLSDGRITPDFAARALRRANRLLSMMHQGDFVAYQKQLESYEK